MLANLEAERATHQRLKRKVRMLYGLVSYYQQGLDSRVREMKTAAARTLILSNQGMQAGQEQRNSC